MKDIKSRESRRRLLKSITAGSGAIVAGKSLPASWSRPVVDSVLLPAHAQTSQTRFTGASAMDSNQAAIQTDNLYADVMDTLVPPASAAGEPILRTMQAHVCITNVGNGKVDVEAVIEETQSPSIDPIFSSLFSATGILANGTPQTLSYVTNGCVVASLMNKLGLIQDAQAGIVLTSDATISVTLGASATGEVVVDHGGVFTMTYDVSGTTCSLPPLVCVL